MLELGHAKLVDATDVGTRTRITSGTMLKILITRTVEDVMDGTKRLIGVLVVAMSMAVAWSGSADARGQCMKRADLKSVLEKHKEAQAAIGLASNGSLIEVFSTADGGSWSIVMTNPKGTSCVVAVGKDWDQRAALEGPAT